MWLREFCFSLICEGGPRALVLVGLAFSVKRFPHLLVKSDLVWCYGGFVVMCGDGDGDGVVVMLWHCCGVVVLL